MTMVEPGTQRAGVAHLALWAPVKPGFVPGAEGFTCVQRLRLLLRTLDAIRLAGRETPLFDSPFPHSVGRFGPLQSFRHALVPPEVGSAGEPPAPPTAAAGPVATFLGRHLRRRLGALPARRLPRPGAAAGCDRRQLRRLPPVVEAWRRRLHPLGAPAGLCDAESALSVVDQRAVEAVERMQRSTDDPARARGAAPGADRADAAMPHPHAGAARAGGHAGAGRSDRPRRARQDRHRPVHGVMQDPDAPELLMGGGAWPGAEGYDDPKTPHACPGHGLSTGVLMGIVSAPVLGVLFNSANGLMNVAGARKMGMGEHRMPVNGHRSVALVEH